MSKKARRKMRQAPQEAARAGGVDEATAGSNAFLLMGDGFQAAGQTEARGYLYWPNLDTRRQLSSWSRQEIARKIEWLYVHFGFARRLCHGMARMLGFLTPQPSTSDEEWNDLAFEAFMGIAGSAQIWDAGGKFDFFEGQYHDNVQMFVRGDELAVLTETSGGRARLAYYEAHQLVTGDRSGAQWVDGVQVGAFSRHLGYSLRDGEDPKKTTFVDARDAIYFGNFDNRGQVRAISILAGAVINMIDVVEVRGFTKTAIKNHSRLGTVQEVDAAAPATTGIGGMGGPVNTVPVTMPDGSTQNINMELVMTGALSPRLPPGVKVKVIADDRPSQNNMDFEKALLKDCCDHADLSYARLCDVAGVTGPGLRMLNADDKRWIAIRHHRQAKRCQRMYNYVIAKEIKAGRLRQPVSRPGEYWWSKCIWIGLPTPDIDAGRTAQATLTDLQSGLTTWMEEAKSGGLYWKRRIKQAIAETIFAKLECIRQATEAGIDAAEVTPQIVFPARYAITNVQPPLAPDTQVNRNANLADPDDPPESET
jgi:hypothetical protein